MDSFAYSRALALESIGLNKKYNNDTETFNGVTFDDLESFARTVAYKVAHNIKNGYVMDNKIDPLVYIECAGSSECDDVDFDK